MIAFIDEHRGAYGVEPICRVLPIAPSTYHAHVIGRADPARLSARAWRIVGWRASRTAHAGFVLDARNRLCMTGGPSIAAGSDLSPESSSSVT